MYTIFILTHEKYKIINNIIALSDFDFKRIQLRDIVKHLSFVANEK